MVSFPQKCRITGNTHKCTGLDLPFLPQLACSILATWGSLIVKPCRTQGNSYNIQMMHVFTFWSTHSCLSFAGFPLQFSNAMDNVLLKEEYAVSISVLSAYALGVCTAFSFITPSRRSFLAYLQRMPLSGWRDGGWKRLNCRDENVGFTAEIRGRK